jgi:hypothetical protein
VSNQGNDQGKTDGARLRVDEAKAEERPSSSSQTNRGNTKSATMTETGFLFQYPAEFADEVNDFLG